jgi:ketopantoate hydroxymethyltransferase
MALISIVPQTKNFEDGLRIIIQEENKEAWVKENAAQLAAIGYVRLVVEPYVVNNVFTGESR